MAEISVIVPCYNAAKWIFQALDSVLGQGLGDLEIIVIDDGSSDNSATIVEENFPLVRLIKTKNKGASQARNLGTRLSTGRYIQYLDADDLLAPGKLKRQIEMLDASGADVAYGGWQELVNTSGDRCLKAGIHRERMLDPEIELFTGFWCPPAVYLFRRSIVEKVGSWNTGLPVIQDARFALDCALNQAKFVYCEGVMAYYRIHSKTSLSNKDSAAFVKDCLQNASEIENWWLAHGGLTKERKAALLRVYDYIAWSSFKTDKSIFESAFAAFNKLEPGYIPFKNKILRLIYRRLGYATAADLAFRYRRIKNIFSGQKYSFRF